MTDIEAMAQVWGIDRAQQFDKWCRLGVKDVFEAEQYVCTRGSFKQAWPEFQGIIQPCLWSAGVALGIVSLVENYP